MKKIKNLIKEPFVLFLLMGALIFIAYTRATGYIDHKNRQVHVNQTQIDNFIMDEIFFKEAVAMGLDKTDPAIKRRLRQIMEMMMVDYATIYPAENQLRTYLSENPEKFRRDHA